VPSGPSNPPSRPAHPSAPSLPSCPSAFAVCLSHRVVVSYWVSSCISPCLIVLVLVLPRIRIYS
jgi:hypothetical protein